MINNERFEQLKLLLSLVALPTQRPLQVCSGVHIPEEKGTFTVIEQALIYTYTYRQIYRQADRQTDRQTGGETH